MKKVWPTSRASKMKTTNFWRLQFRDICEKFHNVNNQKNNVTRNFRDVPRTLRVVQVLYGSSNNIDVDIPNSVEYKINDVEKV